MTEKKLWYIMCYCDDKIEAEEKEICKQAYREIKEDAIKKAEELNYYKAKCGSLEEGLFEQDREISKLEKENKKLKIKNDLLSDELEQAKAVINKKWDEYLKKKELSG